MEENNRLGKKSHEIVARNAVYISRDEHINIFVKHTVKLGKCSLAAEVQESGAGWASGTDGN